MSTKIEIEGITEKKQYSAQEKIAVVKACVERHYNYKYIAEKFSVPYQYVYNWTKSYDEHGEDGFRMSDTEKIEAICKYLVEYPDASMAAMVRATGVPIKTVRNYKKQGLLEKLRNRKVIQENIE